MGLKSYEKAALLLAAYHRNSRLGIGVSPPIKAPTIHRRHVDGPYIRFLDGSVRWLTLWERLTTKFGFRDAWDIELLKFETDTFADEVIR